MAYNNNKGPQHSGDVQYEGDPTDTQIDFENDFVAIKTNGQQRFIVSGSAITASVNISGSGAVTIGGNLTADDNNFRVFGNAVRANDFRTPTTQINATHISSSLNISGSKIYANGVELTPGGGGISFNGSTANGLVTFGGASTADVESNLTFNGSTLSVAGNISGSGTIHAGQAITGSVGIHLTGSSPRLSIGTAGGPEGPQDGMLFVRPSDAAGNNRVLALFQGASAHGQRIVLAASGSGQVFIGGAHIDGGILSVSGSTAEKLITAKSDTANPAFTLRGNGDASISGSLVVSGSVRGQVLDMHTHKANITTSARHYVRFDGAGADSTLGFNNFMVTPYGGKLIKVVVRANSAAGSSIVSFHRGTNGDTNINTTPVESITVNMSAVRTAYTFNFTDTSDWAAGDIVGVAFSGSSSPGNIVLHSVWEMDQNS